MSQRIYFASLCALTLFTAAAQAQQSRADTPCLRIGQIDSFAPIKGNDRALVVTDKSRHRYKLTLTGFCGGLDYNMGVGIRSHGIGRLSCVSHGDEVISKDPGTANNRCPVASVVPYTATMEAADRAAYNAKKH